MDYNFDSDDVDIDNIILYTVYTIQYSLYSIEFTVNSLN